MIDTILSALIVLLGGIGYVRGRVNGLVDTVKKHEERIEEMEERYAECKARLKAQD